ncbi:hypothetical protein [Sphingorhabdus sp.]|uniref:hypothetical protein n=2 Tax=Sphingorhabdus sp. TaxID=1902408 RepID=UPI003C772E6B
MRVFSKGYWISAMAMSVTLAGPAQADLPQNVTRLPTDQRGIDTIRTVLQPVQSRVALRARDTRSDLDPDNSLRTPTVPLNQTSVLSSFRLSFSNGDHHVKHVAVLREGERARGSIADNNGDDNFAFSASWWNIPGVVAGEVSGTGLAADIAEGPPNSTLALVGFRLTVPQDDEVRSISVKLIGETRKAQVGFWTTASNNSRAVDYVIQYAWVPNIYLAGNYSLAGSGMDAGARVGSQASGVVPENARHILRGFELGYNDSNLSAQNLRDFGVHMAPGTGAAEREIVSWQDNDRAEHIKWKVDYSALK